jgi:hypothetical protein
MSDTTAGPAFRLNSRKPTPGETLPYSARLAALGVLLGLAPSAYRRLRYGKRESGNTAGRTALEAGAGAALLGVLPWLARGRFEYSVPGTIPPAPRPGETQDEFNDRTRIKNWGDVDDRLFIPRADKDAAFRKVAQAAARYRNPRNAEEISALFKQHYTPGQLAQVDYGLSAPPVPGPPRRTMWQVHAENQAARESRPVQSVYDEALNNMKQVRNMGIASVGGGALAGGALAAPAAALIALKTTGKLGLKGMNAMYKLYGADQLRQAAANDMQARQLAGSGHPQDALMAHHLRSQAWGNLGAGAIALTPYGMVARGLGAIPGVTRAATKLPAAVRTLYPYISPAPSYAGVALSQLHSQRHGDIADKIDRMPEAEFMRRMVEADPNRNKTAPAGAATQPAAVPYTSQQLVGPTLDSLAAQRGGR